MEFTFEDAHKFRQKNPVPRILICSHERMRLELSSWLEHSNFISNQHEKETSCSFHSLSHSYTCLRLSSDMYIKPAYADMVNSKMSVKLKCRLKNIHKAWHARRQDLHRENIIRLCVIWRRRTVTQNNQSFMEWLRMFEFQAPVSVLCHIMMILR